MSSVNSPNDFAIFYSSTYPTNPFQSGLIDLSTEKYTFNLGLVFSYYLSSLCKRISSYVLLAKSNVIFGDD